MPERPTPPPPATEEPRAPLFTAGELRTAFIASTVGMVGFLVLILLLASSRPQGAYRMADDSQFRSLLAASAEDLTGYELVGGDRARIDIDRAIELVAQRGVDLPLTTIGSDPAAQADGAGGDDAAADVGEVDGEAVYAANCASCHQGTGQGVPGAFPPLANGHLPTLVSAEGGRDYLLHVLLFGVQGRIEVDGQSYDGVMPAWPQLSDGEIAAVLNHELTAWENEASLPAGFEPIAADEVAAVRGEEAAPAEVLELRPEPGAAPAAPAADEASADADVPEEEVDAEDAGDDTPAAAPAADDADGEAIYASNCASCHQPNGQGIPGAFPPLGNGHMPALAAAEGGRDYLLHVLVYGLQGRIEVAGQSYDGVMPAWPQLADGEIAAVLNHELTAWENEGRLPEGFAPVTADEVAAVRGEDLAPADVADLRPAVE